MFRPDCGGNPQRPAYVRLIRKENSMKLLLLAAVFLPVIFGMALLAFAKRIRNAKTAETLFLSGLIISSVLLAAVDILVPNGESVPLIRLTDRILIEFAPDAVGKLFNLITLIVWLLAGIFSLTYMHKEEKLPRYYGFFLAALGILSAFDFSGNLLTMYAFFEMVTLVSVPFVLHEQSKRAQHAGYKYMFFSFCGAYMALFGIYFLFHYTNGDLSFIPGGHFFGEQSGFFLAVSFLMILGFSVKAGMFPLHAWLPAAHPVAPSPASAALSGIIVKSGVLAIFRVVFFVIGKDVLNGTWVQTVWSILALVTVVMGSLLAYLEPVFKKRLAYSTVSQLSYILFGLSLMNENGIAGGISHVVFHAIMKCALFLTAGAIIYGTGVTRADDVYGLGKKNPILMLSYTVVSLGLVGIPLFSGFISKWYLCLGALDSPSGLLGILGIVCLLVSALLTAGYLLPPAIHAFFPGDHEISSFKADFYMTMPVAVLAILTILFGVYSEPLMELLKNIAEVL